MVARSLHDKVINQSENGYLGRLARAIVAWGQESIVGPTRLVLLAGVWVAAWVAGRFVGSFVDVGGHPGILSKYGLVVLAAFGSLSLLAWARSMAIRLGFRASNPVGEGTKSSIGPMELLVLLAVAFAGALAALSSGLGGMAASAVLVGLLGASVVIYRPEVLLLVMAAFPWVDYGARVLLAGNGLGAAWDEVFLLVSIVALFIAIFVTRRSEALVPRLLAPIVLVAVAAIGSVVVMGVPDETATFALRVLLQPMLFFFLALLLPCDDRWFKALIGVFIASSLLLALHGLYQYVTGAPMPARWVDASETGIHTRAYSIIGNPNGLGTLLLLGASLAVGLAVTPLRSWVRVGAAAASVVMTACLAVTFSRGSWLGFIFGLTCFALLAHRRLLIAMAAGAVALPFILPSVLIDRLAFAFSPEYLAKSLTFGRLYIWETAMYRIADHPWFGLGLGTFGSTSANRFGYSPLWIDQYYLQLGAEGGIALLLAFLWLLFRLAKGVVASYLVQEDGLRRAFVSGVFGGMCAVAFANLTASYWETLTVGVGFWFLAGIATRLGLERGVPPPPERGVRVEVLTAREPNRLSE